MKNIKELEEAVFACYQENPILYALYEEKPNFRSHMIKDVNHMSGGRKNRLIHIPNPSMTFLHNILVRKLREFTRGKMPSSYGGVKGESAKTRLEKHRNKSGQAHRYRYLLDLKSAYTQANLPKLSGILLGLDPVFFKSEEDTLEFLEKYCTKDPAPGLVMGGGASPDLFNIYCEFVIDSKLRSFCEARSITYTRFIDDLLFSSDSYPIGRKTKQAIRNIILQAGLIVHERKTHSYDLAKNPVVINGITIHQDGRTGVPRSYLNRVRGIIHRATWVGDVDIRRVQGMVNTIRYISRGRKLTATEAKILNQFQILKQKAA